MEKAKKLMINFFDLHVYNDKKPILKGLSGFLPRSNFTVVLGPNGAGKTTFLRALAGLNSEANKMVSIENCKLTEVSLRRRAQLISWSAANIDIPFAFKVYDILLLSRYPWHQGRPGSSDHSRVAKVLAEMGLDAFANRTLDSLSSGEQKQIHIARAVVQDTPVVIFDEPCAHLDLAVSYKILNYLKKLCEQGKTIIISLHDVSRAYRYAEYSILLNQGTVVYQGDEFPSSEMIQQVFDIEAKYICDDGKKHILFEPIK